MSHTLIGQIAGVLAVIQVIPYVVSILRGHTKPERMTYFIWLIVDAIAIASYIAVGARTTIWVGIVYVFTGLLIFLLSLKYGMGGFSKLDILCVLLAVIGITIWLTTDSALLALCFSTLAAKIGYLPTIKKAYLYPSTENTFSWSMTAVTGILNVFAINSLAPAIVVPVLLGALFPMAVAYFLLFPVAHSRYAKKRRHRHIHTILTHPVLSR